MTSYLFSNEVIEKDSFPQVATQPEKSFKIPEIVTNENESEENQTLSTRTRYTLVRWHFGSNLLERRVTRAQISTNSMPKKSEKKSKFYIKLPNPVLQTVIIYKR